MTLPQKSYSIIFPVVTDLPRSRGREHRCYLLIEGGMSILHCKKNMWMRDLRTQWFTSLLLAKYTHSSSQDHHVLSHYDISLKSRILSFKSGPRMVEARLLWCDSLGTIPLYLYCELKRQVSCPHLPTYNIKTGKDTCYIPSHSK